MLIGLGLSAVHGVFRPLMPVPFSFMNAYLCHCQARELNEAAGKYVADETAFLDMV